MSAAHADLVVTGLVAAHRPGRPVLRGVELQAPAGRITALLGPNGAGKSTLLKAILGLVPSEGRVALGTRSLRDLSAAERAKTVAYVPQRSQLTAPLSVERVVELGRFAHRGVLQGATAADREAVARALRDAGVETLRQRAFPELSGGEQQRVLLARALATEAPVLLLDEPTSALDVRQRLLMHRVLARLRTEGRTVLVVLHDLDEARAHADRAVLLQEGRVAAAGPVGEVVAAGPVGAVYGVELVEGGGLGWRLPRGTTPPGGSP